MIARYTAADAPRVLEMGRAFHAHAAPPWPFDDVGFAQTIDQIAATGFVAVSAGGFIAGVASPNPLSRDWIVAREFLWWSQDRHGNALRQAFRAWAQEIGARVIMWSCPPNSPAAKIFGRRATITEHVFSEYLPCA